MQYFDSLVSFRIDCNIKFFVLMLFRVCIFEKYICFDSPIKLNNVTTLNGPRQANLVLIAYASSESRGTFRQKARSLAPLNGWSCAVKFVMTECSKTQIRLTGLKCKIVIKES